ncbi:PAAR domain-containing protein [Pseudomonas sp. SIMBA_077]
MGRGTVNGIGQGLHGDLTTTGAVCLSSLASATQGGRSVLRLGDKTTPCPQCGKTGVIVDSLPAMLWGGIATVLDGASIYCGCPAGRNRLIAPANARAVTQSAPRRVAAPSETPAPAVTRSTHFTSASTSSFGLTQTLESPCVRNWRFYQKQAEDIIAPGGQLIADPKARNRAINSAYAQLWQLDNRFQWAGLAAFASKQVGCGLLHAAESIENIQAEYEAREHLRRSAKAGVWGLFRAGDRERRAKLLAFEQRKQEYEQALRNNPVPSIDIRSEGEPLSSVQQLYRHVYDMMALGNTTLFLDVFPLHAFYKERGLKLLETCLPYRKKIKDDSQQPVLWPISNEALEFGTNHIEILPAFKAIDAGKISQSVELMAWHEQQNILQPTMYTDPKLVNLLRGNHLSYVTDIPSGVAQAIELTLANQCRPLSDGRTIEFSNNPAANLADINQRMTFVLKAAAQFDALLNSNERHQIEQAIGDIAKGQGAR